MYVYIIILLLAYLILRDPVQEPFTLFTAHPVPKTCSEKWDNLPWHARLSPSGGQMWLSHKPPREIGCQAVNCPQHMDDVDYCWRC